MTNAIAEMKSYCNSLTKYSRFTTREVRIGDIALGGDNPVRIQSMTTTNTMDTMGTVEQTIRMIEAGCDYVRITAPSIKDAENLKNIREELHKRGYKQPLIADIHYTPNAAEAAARIVEKVRVNPGNFADKKKFQTIEYTDDQYNAEIERIRERFSPLVKICKEYGTAMRIGTNHGSLSDRIMSRYGDTPEGMVESALEFVRICEDLGYHEIVLSMKASNPKVMVEAYRHLVARMTAENMNYPLHLGVTEAGDGEDARIKSAAGIGTLLEDGLGDTIRVSLTEEPEFEPPVAIALANRYENRAGHKPIKEIKKLPYDPFHYKRRDAAERLSIGGTNHPVVFADFSKHSPASPADLEQIGYTYSEELDKWKLSDFAADFIYLGSTPAAIDLPLNLRAVYDYDFWKTLPEKLNCFPLLTSAQYLSEESHDAPFYYIKATLDDFSDEFLDTLKTDPSAILLLTTENEHAMPEMRRAFIELLNRNIDTPVVLHRDLGAVHQDNFLLYAATDFGALLLDGFGDGVMAETSNPDITREDVNRILFGILQGTRTRITKTEFIACPSCGRTQFDLVETTDYVRSRTNHLKGLKIAVMGCIVNGPGEMADADYGYVGSGGGKITLYRGQEVVRRGIPSEDAVDGLIEMIKEDGNWVEKE